MNQPAIISTVAELQTALGGGTPMARLFNTKPQNVWHWVNVDKIPADCYLEHKAILDARGIVAAPRLWFGDRVPATSETVEAAE